MGIKGLTSNRKKTFKSSKSQKWNRMVKAEKKKQLPAESIDIVDVHLFSKEKLKNKLRNPKNNIKISGKKRRRLTKRLGHALREKSQMEFEVTDTRSQKFKPGSKVQDTEMSEADNASEVTDSHIHFPSVSISSTVTPSSTKKKRGKKHKKKIVAAAASTSVEGPLFDNADGWEDVQMENDA